LIGIRDLAQYLDISIGTVSRALNGKTDVNPETRRRVIEAAKTLGYSPNQSGRSLRKGRTGLIGVLIPSYSQLTLTDMVFISVLDGLTRCLADHALDLAIFLYSSEEDAFGAFKRVVERRVVDALVISQTQSQDARIDYLIKHAIPFAAFGRSQSGKDHPWVDMNFEGAVDQAVERLASRGHRRIAVVLARHQLNYNHLIEQQFRASMERRGLPVRADHIVQAERGEKGGGEDGGYAGLDALLALPERPTAVIAVDHWLAVGIYKRAREAQIDIGRDLAVIAVNCTAQARFLSPALSYFESDLAFIGDELGRAIVATLGRAHRGPDATAPVQSLAPFRFVEGGSDGAR
jgi:DNA-binding LacI/PurR family transcriptional regulator